MDRIIVSYVSGNCIVYDLETAKPVLRFDLPNEVTIFHQCIIVFFLGWFPPDFLLLLKLPWAPPMRFAVSRFAIQEKSNCYIVKGERNVGGFDENGLVHALE